MVSVTNNGKRMKSLYNDCYVFCFINCDFATFGF